MEKITIIDLRILPPIAIGRLGSSEIPMDAYSLTVEEERPLDFRTIVPEKSITIDENSGEITKFEEEDFIIFKDEGDKADTGTVRPVAPFLEVFAITEENPDVLVPLTLDLLEQAGHTLNDLSWDLDLANIKLFRRTEDVNDKIEAKIENIKSHERISVEATCPNFVTGKTLPLGHIQYVKPTEKYPQIRFRFTPGPGRVYGTKTTRFNGTKEIEDPVWKNANYDFLLYSPDGDWLGYPEGTGPELTNPGQIFAGYEDDDGNQVSWGYLDDECDGFAKVNLNREGKTPLSARAHICAGPPAYAPDTLPIRVVTDELEQILLGPEVNKEVPIQEAEEIIRRALETVRLMNTAIMNGNSYHGKPRIASTMAQQDSNDFGRLFQPIMATSIVDNLAVQAIHDRVFNGIGAGMAPWFENALRRPDEIGDLSDEGRRKMPALMRNADGRALCFTYRQINTIIQCAATSMFQSADRKLNPKGNQTLLVKDVVAQLHYRGAGNPFAVLPRTAISNCFPGLEMDFRNLWRRSFVGLTLIENNNYVLAGEGELSKFVHHRLVGLKYNGKCHPISVPTSGPTMPDAGSSDLITTDNPNGVSFMEWSNNLVDVLQLQGQTITGYFTTKEATYEEVYTEKQLEEGNPGFEAHELTVNSIFQENSAEFTAEILQPGELTQGLCAPWQNDYRECACYYWAASRPDYVNIEPGKDGLSTGDNWMTKKRSGEYIPDDRKDERLVTYDDLFTNWEGELSFVVKGKDANNSEVKENSES